MSSSCPQGKVRNPATGRCVKKEGVLGRKILASSNKKATPKASRKATPKASPKASRKATPKATPKAKGKQRKFKIYAATSEKAEVIRKRYQEELSVSKWFGQAGYDGLKDIKVKLVSTTPKSVVLEVIITADIFDSEFNVAKQVMVDESSEKVGVRGYLKKQSWM